jgi:hypothetical protein
MLIPLLKHLHAPRHVRSWLLLFGALFAFVQLLQHTPLWPEQRIFAGYYTSSFEVSSFVPCGSLRLPGYGQGYWLSIEADRQFYERYSVLSPRTEDFAGAGAIVYVHFIGHLVAPSPGQQGYGHLGMYSREVMASQLLSMAPGQPNRIATLLLAAGIALCCGILLPLDGQAGFKRRAMLVVGLWLELLWLGTLLSVGCI